MTTQAAAALARTTQLIRVDFFGDSIEDELIASELLGTTARVIADERNLSTLSGQTATVTLVQLLTSMGIGVDLRVPDVPLLGVHPPFAGDNLRLAVVGHAEGTIPGVRVGSDIGPADITFVVGDTPAEPHPSTVRISGEAWRARSGPEAAVAPTAWTSDWPFGAFAAATAAAADGFRVAIRRMERSFARNATRSYGDMAITDATIDLSPPADVEVSKRLGQVDLISGGAITTCCLYVLLRVWELQAQLRVIEPDVVDISNLNRYPLMTIHDVGQPKTTVLAGYGTRDVEVVACAHRFDDDFSGNFGALAPRVLVGADDIPTRWEAQRAEPRWLGVAGTTHFFVISSTHSPDGPCAGCVHPRDEIIEGTIPTISFVSFWAGILAARSLLLGAAGAQTGRMLHCSPLGLQHPRGLGEYGVDPQRICPVPCRASRVVCDGNGAYRRSQARSVGHHRTS